MYCKNFGKEIDDKAAVCIHCGVATNNVNDTTTGVMIAVSILFPIIGLIVGIVKLCQGAKSSGGKYIIISIISWVIFYILLSII